MARVGVTAHERIYLDRSDRIIQTQRTPQTQLSWDVLFRTFRDLVPDARYRIKARAQAVHPDPWARGSNIRMGTKRRRISSSGRTASAPSCARRCPAPSRSRAMSAMPPGAVSCRRRRCRIWRSASFSNASPSTKRRARTFWAISCPAPTAPPNWDGGATTGSGRRYTPEELHGILLDIDGTHRPFSLAPGHLRPELAQTLREEAAERLPASFAAAVAAEPRPFIHAIFDYAPAHMVRGRVALMGDAAFVARPHTAMGVAKAPAMPSPCARRCSAIPTSTGPLPPIRPSVSRSVRPSSPMASGSDEGSYSTGPEAPCFLFALACLTEVRGEYGRRTCCPCPRWNGPPACPVPFHDGAADGEPYPHAGGLGGEEGLEDAGDDLLRHAAAGVLDGHLHVCPRQWPVLMRRCRSGVAAFAIA